MGKNKKSAAAKNAAAKNATAKNAAAKNATAKKAAAKNPANNVDPAKLEESSLDQLFSALAQETKPKAQEDDVSEFDKIQQQIESLPKIESGLEVALEKATNDKSSRPLVVKVDDPVAGTSKPKKVEKTDSGADWFNMKKPEITPELKRDLLILKNRSALDPKRHYKKEKWEIPKYFQTGTVIEGNTEFYSARIARKNRGKTLAEEILRDDTTTDYFRRKYTEIQKVHKSGGKQHYKKVKAKRRGY